MDPDLLARVLVAVATTEVGGEALSAQALERLAAQSGTTAFELRAACAYAQSAGLVRLAARRAPWRLTCAGGQYLERAGAVDPALLAFLPQTVDDLNARAALRAGGVRMIDDFRQALLDGHARRHAATLVPDPVPGALTERQALDLFAAAVALMARLEAEQPPACVAEELLAARLVANAGAQLDEDVGGGRLSSSDAAAARAEFASLDDFMPADANLHGPVEDWFEPFRDTSAAGYLVAGLTS
jgi:hypothetical protein